MTYSRCSTCVFRGPQILCSRPYRLAGDCYAPAGCLVITGEEEL